MIFSDVSGCRTLCIFNLIMVVTKKWLAEKYKFSYFFAICVETTTYDDDDDLEYKETFLAQRLRDSLYVQFYGQRGEEGELHSITYVDCYIVLTASAFSSTTSVFIIITIVIIVVIILIVTIIFVITIVINTITIQHQAKNW